MSYHDEQLTEAVAEQLAKTYPGTCASHTGGGIWCVFVPNVLQAGDEYCFGMCDTTWGGDYYPQADAGHEDAYYVETDVPSDSTAVETIAAGIVRALRARAEGGAR